MNAPSIFFDTDILLDVVLREGPWHREAAFLCGLLDEKKVSGFASAISYNNIYYVLRKQIGRKDALARVQRVMEGLELVPLDRKVLTAAHDLGLYDFEDAIQFVSAQRAAADYLVTRNIRDYPTGLPEVLIPGDLLERLNLS